MIYEKNYIVYMHVNNINGKIYIGQTSVNPKTRWNNGKGYYNNKHFYNAINKYGWDNFNHIIIKDGLSMEEANKLEAELINKYKTTDESLGYNIRPGGNNAPVAQKTKDKISKTKTGHIHSKETRKKISENHSNMSGKNNPRYGKHCSEETKAKIRANNKSELRKGIRLSEETRRKMKENHIDASGANNPRARAVVQLTLDEQCVKTFLTAKDAAESINQKGCNITVCCKNYNRTAGGYKWRYADEYNK